jgi:hypothetical protein
MSCTSTSSSASASTSTSSTTASTSSLAALNSDDTSNDHQPPSSVDGLAMKGFLLKLGARWKTWKRRWFALKQGTTLIEYYKSQDEKESPQGSIDLTMITSIEECENNLNLKKEKSEWAFQIVTGSRTYYLVAPDESTMRYWINGLREVCFVVPSLPPKPLQSGASTKSMKPTMHLLLLPCKHPPLFHRHRHCHCARVCVCTYACLICLLGNQTNTRW